MNKIIYSLDDIPAQDIYNGIIRGGGLNLAIIHPSKDLDIAKAIDVIPPSLNACVYSLEIDLLMIGFRDFIEINNKQFRCVIANTDLEIEEKLPHFVLTLAGLT